MMNWKKKVNEIPHKIQIGNKLFYEIVWVDRFDNEQIVGETDFSKKQIRLKIDQSPKEKVMTFLHEVSHAFSDENDIGLTEAQICLLENKVFYYLLKSDNLFSKGK